MHTIEANSIFNSLKGMYYIVLVRGYVYKFTLDCEQLQPLVTSQKKKKSNIIQTSQPIPLTIIGNQNHKMST